MLKGRIKAFAKKIVCHKDVLVNSLGYALVEKSSSKMTGTNSCSASPLFGFTSGRRSVIPEVTLQPSRLRRQ